MIEAALKAHSNTVEKVGELDFDLLGRFIEWTTRRDYNLARIASMLNRSKAVVQAYLHGEYAGNVAEIEKDVSRILQRQSGASDFAKANVFCDTTVARSIWEVLQYCEAHKQMGFAIAPSGTGKTSVAEAYKRYSPKTALITAKFTTRRPGSILRLIGHGLGANTYDRSISALLDSIIWTAERAKKFLIVDDGHFLCWESFECIRTIHDLGGVGVAYLGQERLYDQMRGGARTGFLYDQILSRLAVRRTISHVTRDDAKQIAEGICPELDKASIDFLYSKAQGQGRFRTMVHILDLAVKEASEHGEAVDVHLLRDAAAFLMI